jgi:hypothetical protein
VVYLRNCNHSRRIVVRTEGAPAGRLILPGATTALPIDRAILADPHIQRRLAQVRLAVLDRGGWCADLRQRRAGQLSWRELIAQLERTEMDRLRTVRPEPGRRAYQKQAREERKPRVEWSGEEIAALRRHVAAGLGPTVIAGVSGRPLASVKCKLRQLAPMAAASRQAPLQAAGRSSGLTLATTRAVAAC